MAKDVARRDKVLPISEAERMGGRVTTRIQVAQAVWVLWDRLRKERELDQQWLSDRLDKDKGRVSRLLNGPGNWTLDTVSDLLEAMGGRLTCVEAHTYDEIAEGKAWKAALTERPTNRTVRIREVVIEDNGMSSPALAEELLNGWSVPVTTSVSLAVTPRLLDRVEA